MRKVLTTVSTLFNRYNTALRDSPYKYKMITNGIIFGLADSLCQTFIEEKYQDKKLNYRRVFSMIMIGTFFAAPYSHLWYCKAVPAIVSKFNLSKKVAPVFSTLVTQVIFAPTLLGGLLFLGGFSKEFDLDKTKTHIQRKFWTGIKSNWKLWVPFLLVNFSLVPAHLRVVSTNFIGFFWTTYLSYLQNNEVSTEFMISVDKELLL